MKVNGRTIGSMEDLVRAFESNREGRFHVIEFDNGQTIVLDRAQVEEGEARIRRRYNIRL